MKSVNEMRLTFLSRSANEGFARAAVAAFAAQLDPAVDELADFIVELLLVFGFRVLGFFRRLCGFCRRRGLGFCCCFHRRGL